MKKKFIFFVSLIIFITSLFASEKDNKKDTYIFIDISGSVYTVFNEIQDYAINDIVTTLNKDTNLSIYKFYGKCVNIYDQKLNTDFDFEYAKERIQKLLPNGPWTNLDLVKSVIKDKKINLEESNVYILTDGHQELENGENEYTLSESNINDFLEDCDLINKGSWFLLEYKFKEKTKSVIITETPIKQEADITPTKEKKSFNINLSFIKIIILLVFWLSFICLLISIISFIIWNKLKSKSEELKQFTDYFKYCFKRYLACVFIFIPNLIIFIIYSLFNPISQLILLILSACITIYIVINSTQLLIKNIKYSSKIYSIYKTLTKTEYVDIATLYDIKASDCNVVLYLKRKQISEINFYDSYSNDYIRPKQIVFGLALKKINNFDAIGIQKLNHFYFLNLEQIFTRLNENLSEENRKEIAQSISNSYGNAKLDKFDKLIGFSCGIITGLIDAIFVGKPGESKLQGVVDSFEQKMVLMSSKMLGYKGKDVSGGVKFLEDKFWVPYDKTKINEIGMNEDNHHLLSLAHANDVIGIIFAILDTRLSLIKTMENNGKVYRVVTCLYDHSPESVEKIKANKNLHFILGGLLVQLVEPIVIQSGKLKGVDKMIVKLPQKCVYRFLYENCKDAEQSKTTIMCIFFGFILWLFHLYSDRIGGSRTAKKGNRGTGIVAPLQELFANADIGFANKIAENGEEKLQNGINKIGKELFERGFDNRFYKTQKIPVMLNEYLVKVSFICKEFFYYKKEYDITEIIQIMCPENIIKTGLRAKRGSSNFELEKTLNISFAIFSVIDVGDAILTNPSKVEILLDINYVGILKLLNETLSVFLSYLRRWNSSPDKIIKKIENLANSIPNEESSESNENEQERQTVENNECSLIDVI